MSSARKRQKATRIATMLDGANQKAMLAKHHADCLGQMAEEIARRHDTLRAALSELVALKDQKEAAEKEADEARAIGACPSVRVQRALRDYEERKPTAWAAARAALVPNAEVTGGPLAARPVD